LPHHAWQPGSLSALIAQADRILGIQDKGSSISFDWKLSAAQIQMGKDLLFHFFNLFIVPMKISTGDTLDLAGDAQIKDKLSRIGKGCPMLINVAFGRNHE
jgi:hypothetical protein